MKISAKKCTETDIKHGDFTSLAEDYSKYRPDYAQSVLKAILGVLDKSPADLVIADVGAGTGIWTRMLAKAGIKEMYAVEPNDNMREQGQIHPENGNVQWRKGSGEDTGLPSESLDLVSMASSFHWVDFNKGVNEFLRILKPGGCFVALWNPRFIEANPLLLEIENYLKMIKGEDIKRVSSGRSDFTEALTGRLENVKGFDQVTYLESKHTIDFSKERYMGAWRSVNDLRVQLGDNEFNKFLSWVEEKIADYNAIQAIYLTRAWVACKSS